MITVNQKFFFYALLNMMNISCVMGVQEKGIYRTPLTATQKESPSSRIKVWFKRKNTPAPRQEETEHELSTMPVLSRYQLPYPLLTSETLRFGNQDGLLKIALAYFGSCNPKKGYLFKMLATQTAPTTDDPYHRRILRPYLKLLTREVVTEKKSDLAQQFSGYLYEKFLNSGILPRLPRMNVFNRLIDYDFINLNQVGTRFKQANTLIATANFSDAHLFENSCNDEVFHQTDRQVAECPDLAILRQYLVNNKRVDDLDLVHRTHFIIGVKRRSIINLNQQSFKNASSSVLQDSTQILSNPGTVNIFTMVAKKAIKPGVVYADGTGELVAGLLLPAISAFHNVYAEATRLKKLCVIQTGLWGTGHMGHNPIASLAAQMVAAHIVRTTGTTSLHLAFYLPEALVNIGNINTSKNHPRMQKAVSIFSAAQQIAERSIKKLHRIVKDIDFVPRNLLDDACKVLAQELKESDSGAWIPLKTIGSVIQ